MIGWPAVVLFSAPWPCGSKPLPLSQQLFNFFVFLLVIQVSNLDGAAIPRGKEKYDIKFYIYSGNPENVTIANLVGSREEWYSLVEPGEPLHVLMHGFMGHMESKSVTMIRDALLVKGHKNVIVVDWKDASSVPSLPMMMSYYVTIRDGVPSTARMVTDWLKMVLADNVTEPSRVHLIGFSLGGQIAALVGNQFNGELGRITALDPTNLGYHDKPEDARLSSDDAQFVFVTHTASGFLSVADPLGDVDFYPNGGLPHLQPQCSSDSFVTELTCSHYIAYKFFAESVYNEGAFKAANCPDWETYTSGGCSAGETIPMGYHTPNTTSGSFYLKTADAPPFGDQDSVLPASVMKEMLYTDDESILSINAFAEADPAELVKYNLANLTTDDLYATIDIEPIIRNVLGRSFGNIDSDTAAIDSVQLAGAVPSTTPTPTITTTTTTTTTTARPSPSSAHTLFQTNTLIIFIPIIILYVQFKR